ncbi:MAG: hemolysin III family protein [Alphaproteobacteria bacterium]|nr:hemolysin III family protein [Alphaproteobacteria bacterium]
MIDRLPSLTSVRELIADGVVHALGLGLGVPAALVAIVVAAHGEGRVGPVMLYAAGLIAMVSCSAAYNLLRKSRLRAWLRRFDHAAIFAMIAGTYTPFTVLGLSGAWSIGLTAAVWAIAGLGIAAKLCQPRWIEPVSIALYLALGWIGVVAAGPFLESMTAATLILLATGGVIYSAGVIFHVWRSLPYQNAVWHGFVLVAAGVHYAAVMTVIA